MKNSKFKKILGFAILAATVLSAVLAVSAFAEDETNPEIIAQNVAYEGDFALMYAVDASTATAPVTLYLYTEAPTESSVAHKKYVVENVTAAEGNLEKDSYVFKTEGVAAKDMADVFYVQAIDANGKKSDVVRYSVGEYLYERLATAGITEQQEFLYRQSLTFGAAAQAVLAPETTPVTSFRYVKVVGGLLSDGYNSGIFEIGTELTPVNALASSWKVTSYDDEKNPTVKTIINGESFALEGVTVVEFSDEEILPEGTVSFEGLTALPTGFAKNISSAGSVAIASTTRNGKTTDALKFTSTSHTATDDIRMNPAAYVEEGYNTVVYEFAVNFGTSGAYEIIVRNNEGNQVFNFVAEATGEYFKIQDNSNKSTGYNFWSVAQFAKNGEWVNLRIEITPDPITKTEVLAIYYNGTPIITGVDKSYFTTNNIFCTADQLGRLDIRASSSTNNTIYVDNVRISKVKNDAVRPFGTDTLESGTYPSKISKKNMSEIITDTVYGVESKVIRFAPDGDSTMDTYNIYANSATVSMENAQAIGFAADLKFDNGQDNIAYDFMIDGCLDGAEKTSAVYWLRFISSSGKVYIQNQKNTAEKFLLGNLDEYFNFQMAYTVVDGVSMIHILSNGVYVGTFTAQYNAGSCPISAVQNIRLRTMSNYNSYVYLDNFFYGPCYIDFMQ